MLSNVPSKPIKSKVSCKPVFNIPTKSINSNDACKSVSNVKIIKISLIKMVKSKFTGKRVSNVSSKHV